MDNNDDGNDHHTETNKQTNQRTNKIHPYVASIIVYIRRDLYVVSIQEIKSTEENEKKSLLQTPTRKKKETVFLYGLLGFPSCVFDCIVLCGRKIIGDC